MNLEPMQLGWLRVPGPGASPSSAWPTKPDLGNGNSSSNVRGETMKVALFRKRPVIVEALQWHGRDEDRAAMRAFLNGSRVGGVLNIRGRRGEDLLIPTLEGDMLALPGDWIIRGIKGEFYPCKPDIFEATYQAVDVPTPP